MKPLNDAMLDPDLFGRTFGGAPTRPFIEGCPEVHPVREAHRLARLVLDLRG